MNCLDCGTQEGVEMEDAHTQPEDGRGKDPNASIPLCRDELHIEPSIQTHDRVDVRSQTDIHLEEIPLINDDPEALAALKILHEKGYSPDQVEEAYEGLQRRGQPS